MSAPAGMLRLLTWSAGLGADKVTTPELKILPARRHRSPSMESQSIHKLKRKRIDGDEAETIRGPTKRRVERVSHVLIPKQNLSAGSSRASPPAQPQKATEPAQTPTQDSTLPSSESLEDSIMDLPSQGTMPKSRSQKEVESLRRTIQSQMGLEILLKHDELRLIDQEIAKCQIALEQLRRCSEIPYPASNLSLAVSTGEGPALRSSFAGPLPPSPAPWGVTDGPYTRHYAKWLLSDPKFDGSQATDLTMALTPAGKTPLEGRSTRGSFAETTSSAVKMRSQRGGKLKALSTGYPQPKDKSGPMIQKRKSDGLIVKLVCLDCRRDNFSSAQGFINHCRIAHGRSFASHDAAADACGEPVEVDEAGSVIGSEAPSTSMAGVVHPLIRSAHTLKQKVDVEATVAKDNVAGSSRPSSDPHLPKSLRLRGGSDIVPSPNYRASSLTPHLSDFIRNKGLGLNLEDLVSDANYHPETEDSSADESEAEGQITPPEAPFLGRHPQIAGTKQPQRSAISSASPDQPTSMKATKRLDQKSHSPQTAGTLTSPSRSPLPPRSLLSTAYMAHGGESIEPSPTNEFNQAPSLVDDDDEYEAHSSPSLSSQASENHEDADLNFVVEDDETSGPSTRAASSADSEFATGPKPHIEPPQRRRPSAFRRSMGNREEKHVSFVSPSPAMERSDPKKGHERKRKRT